VRAKPPWAGGSRARPWLVFQDDQSIGSFPQLFLFVEEPGGGGGAIEQSTRGVTGHIFPQHDVWRPGWACGSLSTSSR
jgi:hypothetical protein